MEEIQNTTRTYPGNALLAIEGVASSQVTSLQNLNVSGLVQGKKVKVWDGAIFTLQFSDKRAWVVRDILTHPKVGLGHRVAESMHDDDAALTAQTFWDTNVAGFGGNEIRDRTNRARRSEAVHRRSP